MKTGANIKSTPLPPFLTLVHAFLSDLKAPPTDDAEKLLRDFGIFSRGLVELGALALVADGAAFPYKRAIVSLAKMVALYTGKQLLKDDVRTSDWERPLGAEQIQCSSASFIPAM